MKVTRTEWTQEQIDKLIEYTKQYRENSQEINWDIVSGQMQMSRSQCKSYYQIVLKKQLNLEQRKNHMWSKDEVMGLWAAMQNNNENLELVQKQYFPAFTMKQLRGQYASMAKRHVQYKSDFSSVKQNPQFVSQIEHKSFITECYVIKNACIRKILIDEGYQGLQNAKSISESERKAFDQFWGNIDPEKLAPVFTAEQQRRKINEKEVDAVKTI
ncbi:Myb-like_DNA-binding domain-containing protein [Hexamita inflata]|uniref:Myb-like DNA-binding domain-containing protein n=1 Tax=Hexamita inflata TaxID=28002 RepID=A0AA86NCK9_9EUKA|nr:Myb-like DNA-binding domain-containing protein [Hexamita inflata]